MFSDGSYSETELNRTIEKLLSDQDLSLLSHVDPIYRATFVERDGRWVLVTDESPLKEGEKIIRKIPNMLIPNYYYSEETYLALFRK